MTATTPSSKKIIALTAVTAVATVLFSIMGAPFLRVLSSATARWIFWGAGVFLCALLAAAGLFVEAIFIGSIWTTLGVYTELERRGIAWRTSFFASLAGGALFAAIFGVSALMIGTSSEATKVALDQAAAPILALLSEAFPDKKFEAVNLVPYIPGAILASLMLSLSAGLAFESQIFRAFQIKRERIVAGLRWLDFRLPDWFVWVSVIGLFFAFVEVGLPSQLAVFGANILFVAAAAFFVQGLVIFEFASRIYRFGPFFKISIYMLIMFWAMPAVVLMGLADYWMDFRNRMTSRIVKKNGEST